MQLIACEKVCRQQQFRAWLIFPILTLLSDSLFASNTGNECSPLPDIQIESYDNVGDGFNRSIPGAGVGELHVNKTNGFIQAPYISLVGIECTASVPIEWIFVGVNAPSIQSVSTERKVGVDDSSQCFRVTILLRTLRKSTGGYICQTMDKKNSSRIHVYGEAKTTRVLLNDQLVIRILAYSDSTVVLPCNGVTSSSAPTLFKGTNETEFLDAKYDPKVGFTVDLKEIPDPFDLYKCQSGDGSSVLSTVRKSGYEVIPFKRSVLVLENQVVSLTCKSINPVGMVGLSSTFNGAEGVDPYYNFSVNYEFNGTSSSSITCQDLTTKKLLHTWDIRVISEEAMAAQGIFYNASKNAFICRSRTSQAPGIALINCNNTIICNLASKSYTWQGPKYKITSGRRDDPSGLEIPNRGCYNRACSHEDRIAFNSTLTSCSHIKKENAYEAGIVRCSFEGESEDQILQYFTGVDKTVFTDWREATSKQLIQIQSENVTFYVGQNTTFCCTTTNFLFAHGFRWFYKLENETFVKANVMKRGHWNEDFPEKSSMIKEYAIINITTLDIKSVVCKVPFWNTTGWMNVTQKITVKNREFPVIYNPVVDYGVSDAIVGQTHSILCQAKGIPIPEVQWSRQVYNKTRGKFKYERKTSKTELNGLLDFGVVRKEDAGNYTCVASNNIGDRRNQTITLRVAENHTGSILIVTLTVSFFCAMVLALALWRSVYLKTQEIAKLTEDESNVFLYGGNYVTQEDGSVDPVARPYDTSLEIPEDELVIGDRISGGNFGIVYKASYTRPGKEAITVALKTLKNPRNRQHLLLLLAELKILDYIGDHEHIIKLLGAVTPSSGHIGNVYLVLEHCETGSLEVFLKGSRGNLYLNQIQNDAINFDIQFVQRPASARNYVYGHRTCTRDLIRICYEITIGLLYLHSKRVVHGDIAARNVLLTANRTVKIIDCGLSMRLPREMEITGRVNHLEEALPLQWLAPETITNHHFSTQSDIWAFGIVLWEIFTLGEEPYYTLQPITTENLLHILNGGFRLSRPEFANTQIYNAMLECWTMSSTDRISFKDLRKFFHKILQA